jgi:spermidine/putrescine transport system permease protein
MVYNFLPFMILPIHTVLSKMDHDLINAARDLGANNFQVFTKVIFPLSLPGVVSGVTMVFMPAVSTFVISKLLGGGQFYLIGNLIEQEFMSVGDWHFGSAISIFMMIIILISMAIMNKYSNGNDKEGGGLLL